MKIKHGELFFLFVNSCHGPINIGDQLFFIFEIKLDFDGKIFVVSGR